MALIRFKFAPHKARAALHWIARQQPNVDLHTILKACYFADREHLNKYGRPIFGATYRAMRFGPVPLEIYEMAKGEPIWLTELDVARYPWQLVDGYRLKLSDNDEPDMRPLSPSDIEALKSAFKLSSGMTFDGRTAMTHGKDWQAANLGPMRYEDMFDEDVPDRAEKIAYLQEAGKHLRL